MSDNLPAQTQLTEVEARELTDRIAVMTEQLWEELDRAHAGRADKALGYGSWAEYVEAEFNMTRQRSYQLLAQAEVVHAIADAAQVKTNALVMTSREASKVKGVLPSVTQTLREKTKGKQEPARARIAVEVVDAAVRDATPNSAALSSVDALEKLLGRGAIRLVEQAGPERARKISRTLNRFAADWQMALSQPFRDAEAAATKVQIQDVKPNPVAKFGSDRDVEPNLKKGSK